MLLALKLNTAKLLYQKTYRILYRILYASLKLVWFQPGCRFLVASQHCRLSAEPGLNRIIDKKLIK